MITSFKDKETEKVYAREGTNKLPRNIQQVALRKLCMINNARNLVDLRIPPANRLERLGDHEGQLSIRINDQWRVYFVWQGGDAYVIEITDYH